MADEQRKRLEGLRLNAATQFGEAAMHKIWEEHDFMNSVTDRLSSKMEQLRINEEKTNAQSELVALSKRKLQMLEQELADAKKRNEFMAK